MSKGSDCNPNESVNSNVTSAGSINPAYSGKTPHENEEILIIFHTSLFVEITTEQLSLMQLSI